MQIRYLLQFACASFLFCFFYLLTIFNKMIVVLLEMNFVIFLPNYFFSSKVLMDILVGYPCNDMSQNNRICQLSLIFSWFEI